MKVPVLGVVWHGEAKLYDGWLRGLASIHRSDNAEFIKNSDGRVLGILAGLQLGDMKLYFEALLDTQTCKFKAEILEVTKLGSIDVSIQGLSVLGWIIASLVDFVMVFIGGFIRSIVETIMKDMTDQVLDGIDLHPIGSILGCDPVAAAPVAPFH
ncbi:hypothetical protein GWK47_034707 [Chionoecetes opilio]|uniref:Uncharacterized protein n=1 Tax=Chionoecetes opilio TaxID=41210 RepID=A0A8J4YR13_CHIOP|nr:hypothetical protein GWK47_034707 [Chionoecetes opilio]